LVIGVTGGIGSGKSLFTRELGRLGAYTIDADKIARVLIEHNKTIRRQIKESFGSEMFDKEDNVKRRKLGKLVFSNPVLLKQLNTIIQESLITEINRHIKNFRKKYKNSIIVVDMAIIFEAGAESIFDYIVIVDAPLDMRIKWLKKDRGWTEKEIKDRISSQMDTEKKIEKSDFVINNNGSVKDLNVKASEFYNLIFSLSLKRNNN